MNKTYVLFVFALTIVFPAISIWIDSIFRAGNAVDLALAGKWFIFYAVGIRLFIAGVRQMVDPSFTAKEIFEIEDRSCHPVIRELGFANLCFGLIGIISLFMPSWRIVSAFGSGLYFGLAGIMHLTRKPADINGRFALVTDLFIFLVLLAYVAMMF